HDDATGRATGVRVIDAKTKQVTEYRARVVFLCASALESARLLLHSSIANSSGQVGRNVMDHIKGGGATGRIPGYLDRCVIGNRPNGIYVPRFRNVKTKSEFLRGYGFQGNARRLEWGDNIFTKGIGIDLKKQLSTLGPWTMSFYGYGEC